MGDGPNLQAHHMKKWAFSRNKKNLTPNFLLSQAWQKHLLRCPQPIRPQCSRPTFAEWASLPVRANIPSCSRRQEVFAPTSPVVASHQFVDVPCEGAQTRSVVQCSPDSFRGDVHHMLRFVLKVPQYGVSGSVWISPPHGRTDPRWGVEHCTMWPRGSWFRYSMDGPLSSCHNCLPFDESALLIHAPNLFFRATSRVIQWRVHCQQPQFFLANPVHELTSWAFRNMVRQLIDVRCAIRHICFEVLGEQFVCKASPPSGANRHQCAGPSRGSSSFARSPSMEGQPLWTSARVCRRQGCNTPVPNRCRLPFCQDHCTSRRCSVHAQQTRTQERHCRFRGCQARVPPECSNGFCNEHCTSPQSSVHFPARPRCTSSVCRSPPSQDVWWGVGSSLHPSMPSTGSHQASTGAEESQLVVARVWNGGYRTENEGSVCWVLRLTILSSLQTTFRRFWLNTGFSWKRSHCCLTSSLRGHCSFIALPDAPITSWDRCDQTWWQSSQWVMTNVCGGVCTRWWTFSRSPLHWWGSGLNLRSATRTSTSAWWTSWQDTLPMIHCRSYLSLENPFYHRFLFRL